MAREARKRGVQGVVCGHIHHAELRDIDGILYANDGDWVESLTALAEHADGTARDPALGRAHAGHDAGRTRSFAARAGARMTRAPLPNPPSAAHRTVDLVYFNAGGGHRASALALEAAIQRAGLPWTVRLVNLREVLDPNDGFRKLTGMDPEDVYNKRLARGWTLGLTHELKVLQAVIRWAKPKLVRPLQQHWLATEPDMVVSLIPNFNRSLYESVATALPGVPYVTVLTDLADHPPHFWIEKGQDQYFVCGSAKAVQQARAAGYAQDRIHATSGMMIRSAFYETQPIDRAEERRRLGLDPDRPTGLVLFGGQGSKAMIGIAKRLPDMQLILACGHNESLAKALRALPARAPRAGAGLHARRRALHAAVRFLHRQAGARQRQRGGAAASAGDRGVQQLDPAPGTLQRPVGARAGRGPGALELCQGARRGRGTGARSRPLSRRHATRCTTVRCSRCRASCRASWRRPRRGWLARCRSRNRPCRPDSAEGAPQAPWTRPIASLSASTTTAPTVTPTAKRSHDQFRRTGSCVRCAGLSAASLLLSDSSWDPSPSGGRRKIM